MANKLEICKQTRKIAADSLAKVLKKLLSKKTPISEVKLRDEWLKELRKHKSIFPEGWYSPPPHGIGVLFGTDININRVSPKSLRTKDNWPRKDIYLDRKNGVAMLYISPVDKDSGIIGDFGLTLYFGKNKVIQKHLKTTLEINRKIYSFVAVGKRFKEIISHTHGELGRVNLYTNLASPSDPAGTNIGHTIPFSYEDITSIEAGILTKANKNWDNFKNMISKRRIFVSNLENFKVSENMAFTIEPRPQSKKNENIPMVWFHTIVLMKEGGSKELLTNFEELFKIAGMKYML